MLTGRLPVTMSHPVTPFVLSTETAVSWVNEQGLNPTGAWLEARELAGGVSAAVIAVRGSGVGVVVKQALPRLRVADVWEAKVERTELEVAALELLGSVTPGVVPAVLAHDPAHHVFAMELLPAAARNWQEEIAAGRTHVEAGAWAGAILGRWHRHTPATDDAVARSFDDVESFEQQRLLPFHETVMRRRPELTAAIAPYVDELRSERVCLVDGDYAPKNMLVAADGRRWKLDFEVVHVGNPVFDLGFFLSFLVLSAVRWPALAAELRTSASAFLDAYEAEAGARLAVEERSITGHTACLVLARTDGKSPASFLDPAGRERARAVGISLLEHPERGLWAWR